MELQATRVVLGGWWRGCLLLRLVGCLCCLVGSLIDISFA